MATTAPSPIRPAIRSLTTTAPAEQRRAALIELADVIDTEDRYPASAPFSSVLALIVPPLCSHKVAGDVETVLGAFGQLVEAVAEFRRFVSDEAEWLLAHDLPTTDRQRWSTHMHLQSDVDMWADRLIAVSS